MYGLYGVRPRSSDRGHRLPALAKSVAVQQGSVLNPTCGCTSGIREQTVTARCETMQGEGVDIGGGGFGTVFKRIKDK
jgi:hypothetical protein